MTCIRWTGPLSRHEKYKKFIKGFSQATLREETTWKTPTQKEEYHYKESQIHRVWREGGIDQHNLGQERDQWWDLVKRDMNLWFDVFPTVHHSIGYFLEPTLMHTSI